jgi:hypothetical protein
MTAMESWPRIVGKYSIPSQAWMAIKPLAHSAIPLDLSLLSRRILQGARDCFARRR